MKKVICLLLLSMVLLLTAYTEQANTDATANPGGTAAESGTAAAGSKSEADSKSKISPDQAAPLLNITIETPMTLSDNLVQYGDTSAHLRLRMVSGKYYEDWNPGAYMGTVWEGSFIFELSDEFGKTLAKTDLGKYYTEPLIFTSNFDLEFDDYNNDGDMDFTLGQYASSNGRVYKLFTLKSDGTVEALMVKDEPELFISDSSGYYSSKLQKINNTSFRTRYYDNSQGKNYESVYEWGDGVFTSTGMREILPLDDYYDVMSDPSLSPKDMLGYIRKNIIHASTGDATGLLLKLEQLQKNYQDGLADRYYSGNFMESELSKLYDNDAIQINIDDIKDSRLHELLNDMRSSGFKMVRAEGSLYPVIDYSVYLEFNTYLQEDIGGYFTLMAEESEQLPAMDAGLIISWEEIIKRAFAQEQFIISFDQSQKWYEVQSLYKEYVSYVFYGLPNTPDFIYETKTMDPQLKKSLLDVVQKKGNTPLKNVISDYLDVLSKNKYKLTDEVEQFRKNAITLLSK